MQNIPQRIEEEWARGRASLGAAAGWTAEEMRLIADLGYALAEYGRDEEALAIFEGLAALTPATAYFQSALGALKLRLGDLENALPHLNAALAADPSDAAALINRGELYMRLNEPEAAVKDLRTVLSLPDVQAGGVSTNQSARARALLLRLSDDQQMLAE